MWSNVPLAVCFRQDLPQQRSIHTDCGSGILLAAHTIQHGFDCCDALPDHTHGSFATDRCAMTIGPCPQCPESDGWARMHCPPLSASKLLRAGFDGPDGRTKWC